MSQSFTPFPEVNIVLDALLNDVPHLLKEEFVGIYLFGSLTNGGFDENSDVDVLVVTHDKISDEVFSALEIMHARIATLDSWCATQLEVVYIPQDALRRYDPKNNIHPHLDRGRGEELHQVQHDMDWVVQRFTLCERSITLTGPDPRTLIDPVSPDDMRQAMMSVLHDWLAGLINDPSQIKDRGYQSYIVLTVCRVLYTLQCGDVVSKHAAANWAKETLDARWIPLIERAWVGRQNPQEKAGLEEIKETQNLIRFALEQSKQSPHVIITI